MFLCWTMWLRTESIIWAGWLPGWPVMALAFLSKEYSLRGLDTAQYRRCRLKYTQLWITSPDWLGTDVCRLKYSRATLTCVRFFTSQLGMGVKYWLLYISSLIEEANFPTTDCRAWSQSVENSNQVFLTINVLCFHKLCSKDFLSLEELWKWMEITMSVDVLVLQYLHLSEADKGGLEWKPNSFPD